MNMKSPVWMSLLVACLPLLAQAAPAPLGDPFFSYTREPEYDSVAKVRGISVPVRRPSGDTSHIDCTLYRPAQGGVAVEGKFPGIVIDYHAYHLVNVITDSSGGYDFFPLRGYNVMVCDPPGAGNSPGLVDQFGPAETMANYDLIEWFAVQPWSDGNIGQHGTSYGGHTTNKVASFAPPHLKAIVPNSSFADWYEQTIYHGGIRNLSIFYQPVVVGGTGIGGSNPLGGIVGNVTQTLLTYSLHPLYDDFWRDRSVMPRWDQFTVPALITDGWDDRYRDGTVKNYMARRSNVWLLLGPWGHSAYEGKTEVGTLDPASHQLAWYDYWLKRRPGAMLPRAKISSFEMPDAEDSLGWNQFSDWPPPAVRKQRLHFGADRTLSESRASDSVMLGWIVNPLDIGSDPAGGTAPAGIDQRLFDAAPYRLTFSTAPLQDDLVITGASELVINTALSASDGNIVARLMDVLPDGSVSQVATGWLKASHYRGHDHLEILEPGTRYTLQVHIAPTHWRFRKGHALRISLSSGDVPDAVPDAPLGRINVQAGGEGGSYVDIPVLTRSSASGSAGADGSGGESQGKSGGGSLGGVLLLPLLALAALRRRLLLRRCGDRASWRQACQLPLPVGCAYCAHDWLAKMQR